MRGPVGLLTFPAGLGYVDTQKPGLTPLWRKELFALVALSEDAKICTHHKFADVAPSATDATDIGVIACYIRSV